MEVNGTARHGRHPGLILGVARFFHDPRASMRGVLDSRPGEGRLLLYALLAAAIWIGGRLWVAFASEIHWQADVHGLVAAHAYSIGFLALFFYALAALGTAFAKACGGRGSWREGRAAFFWAALVSAPVVALSSFAALALQGAPGALTVAVAQSGPVFFAWALAQCFAEAFGFARSWTVFAAIGALVLLIVFALRLASF